MMNLEARNEPQMLRQFWKKYPSYNLNALMRQRYEELMDATRLSTSGSRTAS